MIGLGKLTSIMLAAALFSGGAVFGALSIQNGLNVAGDSGGVDYGLDTDGDGLYDFLVVEMPIDVEEPGYHNAYAQLLADALPPSDCFDNTFGPSSGSMDYPISFAYVRVFLDLTDDTIKIAFDGKDINWAGVDGPYKVQVYVFMDDDYFLHTSDSRPVPSDIWDGDLTPPTPWEHITAPYKYTDFEEPTWAIRFTGTNSDQGIDVDGNGLYEYLRVTSEVDVRLAGNYSISATIMWRWEEPPDPTDILWPYPFVYFSDIVDLELGVQTIDFDLPGGQIRESGVDGPYDIYLFASYIGYHYWNRSNSGGIEPPPLTDSTVHPSSPGQIVPWPRWGDFDFYFDSECHTSQAYTHDEFEELPPDLIFTGEFADYGNDRDGNGLFEELVVEAGVEVYQAGFYTVMAVLSAEGVDISFYFDIVYLDTGGQTLYMWFQGYEIEASGLDGPYDVKITVMSMERPGFHEATYTTSAYTHDQFEGRGGNGTRMYWISDLSVRTTGEPPEIEGSAVVTITRGPDLLTYVIEDVCYLVITDMMGTVVFSGESPFSIAGGGQSTQVSFSFTLPDHGTYTATAYLTSIEDPTSVMDITFVA